MPILVGIALYAAWRLGYFELDQRQQLFERVQRLRMTPGIEAGFIVAFSLVVILCLPATIVTVLGGAVFGARFGAAFGLAGALIGTTAAYLISRTVARRPVQRIFGEHRLLRRLRERDGVVWLFRLRVLPVAPFGVLPYVAGIANVSLRRLLIATLFGALPSVVAYAYVGDELLTAAASGGDASSRALWVAAAVTLGMIGLSTIPGLLRRKAG